MILSDSHRRQEDFLVAIQGEAGSNSHMAALEVLAKIVDRLKIIPCRLSAHVMEALISGAADAAVLPIENSLHGSVAEHYDLLLEHPVRITRELRFRVHHNLIALPGVERGEVRRILSHPVALSQCRRFLASMEPAQAEPFYDTAGSLKHIAEHGLRDAAALAPALAAEVYGGVLLAENVEDHAENYTRFHLLQRLGSTPLAAESSDRLALAFAVEHRPGSLVAALAAMAAEGADLTKIESRPVPGKPWEYMFYVDVRIADEESGKRIASAIAAHCTFTKVLGVFRALP